jgi:Cu/Ag efflux pump CusA
MTTVGAILALMPLALGLGAGAAMQRPLAIAVIGGLCLSTIFPLLGIREAEDIVEFYIDVKSAASNQAES